MPRQWSMGGIRDALRRNWRVRPHAYSRDDLVGELVVRQLEERRVLTVSPAVALALAAAGGENDIADATLSDPDPATPLGTDAAHQAPVDPGDRTVQGEGAIQESQEANGDGPAAENLDESDNASAAQPESVQASVASDVDSEESGLELTVADDPDPTFEGTTLSIENIGEFTDTALLAAGGDAETSEYTFTIDWGDGLSSTGMATIDFPGSEGDPLRGSFDGEHTYADNGVYTVTVTLTSPSNETVTGTLRVIVENVQPNVHDTQFPPITEGETFTVVFRFDDPGFNNELNPEGEVEETFTFAIDWGDGSEIDSGPATADDGGVGVPTEGFFEGTHTYADNGVYAVTVTVIDDDGGRATRTFTVIVENANPVFVGEVDDVTIDEGSTVIQDFQFEDVGFDNPDNPAGEVAETFTFAIDWGDGSEVDSGPATIDVAGGVGVPTQGSFRGAHTYADDGAYTVTVTIIDDDGGRDTLTFTVFVNNVAPRLELNPDAIDENESAVLTGSFADPGLLDEHTLTIDWDDPNDASDSTFVLPATNDLSVGQKFTSTTDSAELEITLIDFEAGTVSFRVQHQYLDDGSAPGNQTPSDVSNVLMIASDDDEGTGDATVQVTVNNVAPVLTDVSVGSTGGGGSGGPLVLMGIDAEDGGVGGHGDIEVYESVVSAILANVTNGGSGILVIGGGKNPSDDVTEFWNRIAEDLSLDVTYVNGADDIAEVQFDGYAMIVVVSDQLNTPDGGLTNAENNALALRATDVRNFVNNGGGLLGFSSADLDIPYGYLGELGSFVFAGESDYNDITPTEAGGEIGITDALDVTAWHDTYEEFPDFMQVLAVRADTGGVAAIGGSQVVVVSTVIDEGESVTLTGSFTDPGLLDGHVVTIDWGDGTTETYTLAPGAREFSFTHRYLDDGPSPGNSTPSDAYQVVLTLGDDDGGQSPGDAQVTVRNVIPEVLPDPGGMIFENDFATLTGSFSDPGLLDVHDFAVNWDDPNDAAGSTFVLPGAMNLHVGDTFQSTTDDAVLTITDVDLDSGEVTFRLEHRYLDDGASPGNTQPSDVSTIRVAVLDDDQDRTGEPLDVATTLIVGNVSPEIVPGSVGVSSPTDFRATLGEVVTLATDFTDVGMLDAHTVIVDWGDGSMSHSELTPDDFGSFTDSIGGGVGAVTASHAYATGGSFTVTITVFDDDGGSATTQATFDSAIVLLRPPDPIFVPGGGGGPTPARPTLPEPATPPLAAPNPTPIEFRRGGVATVAGEEPRLVLRDVSLPESKRPPDERLPDDVLDNLKQLYKRLPDGHYRIYKIEADGTQRLVVDFVVRQGRKIDISDEAEGAGPSSEPETNEPEPAAVPTQSGDSPADEARVDDAEPDGQNWALAAAALGGGYFAYAAPLGRRRLRTARRRRSPELTKARRLLRRIEVNERC